MKDVKKITLIIICLVAIGLYVVSDRSYGGNENKSIVTGFKLGPQVVVDRVLIDEVTTEESAFIAIREIINNKLGQIIEVSDVIQIGKSKNIFIGIDASLLAETEGNKDLVAVLYIDDGDNGFNPGLDTIAESEGYVQARYVETGEYVLNQSIFSVDQSQNKKPQTIVVEYTDDGFLPESIQISKGETVTFINKSNDEM